MKYPAFFDSMNSFKLFGFKDRFDLLHSLYIKKKLPKVIMFSGPKGSGKSTLINHFLFSIFEKNNYDKENLLFYDKTNFYNQFKNNIFPNIIYLKGSDFKSVKIDDIRSLKSRIFQSSILNSERFIIFDDIELFNINSLNALLKTIEEPGNNHFFLINNNSKPILDTIKSRALEIRIILKEKERLSIIENLINFYKLDVVLDRNNSRLTPGNFIKYNHVCIEYDINLSNNFLKNLSILFNLFKKNKDFLLINIIFFITDQYIKNLHDKNTYGKEKIYELRKYIFEKLNIFLKYNISHNALINQLASKLNHE